ncbi:MAG: NH(3)-dependent NAD(+) synthetase [Candidatus Peregrinibacteria bacterium GW2011_GWA2_47_7]|nr:MAG: NH(3)-dependent NAD(+) synthetase [Candidatus Peregrinibacteria bacterium GW2011_GWA2_47_7]
MHVIYSTLVQELHSFAKAHQFEKAVLGLSGGLDSAVALCIAIRAFGAKNVTALILPEMGTTPGDDIDHAKILAEFFGCEVEYQPINNFLVDFHFVPWDQNEEAAQNLRARMRATVLHHYSEVHNAMIIGTANKSDLQLGFGQLDGAFTGHLHILGDLYKSDVIDLARALNLPPELVDGPYSRNLKFHQTDEEDLGASWNKIDDILQQLEDKVEPDALIEKGMDALLVHKLIRLVHENEALPKSVSTIHVGRISESIKNAQKAEAESLRTYP